jgi:hypothetical protein
MHLAVAAVLIPVLAATLPAQRRSSRIRPAVGWRIGSAGARDGWLGGVTCEEAPCVDLTTSHIAQPVAQTESESR